MDKTIKQRIASGAAAVAQPTDQTQRGGAACLVAALVQAQLDDTVNVEVVDSPNNLRALKNILNNSPILSNNDIDVVVQEIDADVLTIEIGDVTIQKILNDLTAVVGVIILGDDLIVLT